MNPLVGPILSSILLYASTREDIRSGIFLLLAYSLGMGLPFLACSLALNTFLSTFQKPPALGSLTKVGGALLVLVGVLLLTDSFPFLSDLFSRLFPETPGRVSRLHDKIRKNWKQGSESRFPMIRELEQKFSFPTVIDFLEKGEGYSPSTA